MQLTICQARGLPRSGRSNKGGGGPGRRPPRQGSNKSGSSSRSTGSSAGSRDKDRKDSSSSGSSSRRATDSADDRDDLSLAISAKEASRLRRARGFSSTEMQAEGATITITEAPPGPGPAATAALSPLPLPQQQWGGSTGAALVGAGAGPPWDEGEGEEELPETETESDWDDVAGDELSDAELAELRGEGLVLALAGDAEGGEGGARAPAADMDAAVDALLPPLLAQFAFPLDAFQLQALRRLLAGRSVVVCAPTGAGKTAIAEAAAIHWLARQRRVVYTTPLKARALSNQKLLELRERFGPERVGLLTGDASINPDAEVVVMTTEILRNQLYRQGSGSAPAPAAGSGGGGSGGAGDAAAATAPDPASASRLADVALVVLDEVHYLGDPGRGSVWEEVVCALPAHCQLLAMSATVRNPEDLGGWITQVHGPCDTIRTTFRPVPLSWHWCQLAPQRGRSGANDAESAESVAARLRLLPLLDAHSRSLNPLLLPPSKRFLDDKGDSRSSDPWGSDDDEADDDGGWGRWDGLAGGRRGMVQREVSARGGRRGMRPRTIDELIGAVVPDADLHDAPRWKRIPPIETVVAELASHRMLPAVWFIFSRRDCDAAAVLLAERGLMLTSEEERAAIEAEVHALRAEQPEAIKTPLLPALLAGAAAHHAGCLPAWKGLVERLFQRGLLKVVFATETLAAGINMPARSTLVGALSRRRDGGVVALQHNELLQMAGRAGRRGYDTQGSCVLVQGPWEDADAAWDIIRRGPEPLRSRFATGYGLVLNLLASRSLPEARAFLDRSFSQYLGSIGAARRIREAEALEARAQAALGDVARRAGGRQGDGSITGIEEQLERYEKLQGRLREEKRAAKLLRAQLVDERAAAAAAALALSGLPVPVGLDLSASNVDAGSYRLPALAVAARPAAGAAPGGGGGSGGGLQGEMAALLEVSPRADVEAGGDGWTFLCLGADNCLYEVGARQVAAVLAGDKGDAGAGASRSGNSSSSGGGSSSPGGFIEAVRAAAAAAAAAPPASDQEAARHTEREARAQAEQRRAWVDAAAAVADHAASLHPSAWKQLAGGARSAQGSALTATAAARLPSAAALPDVPLPVSGAAGGAQALAAQRTRVKEVKRQLADLREDRAFARASRQYARVAARTGVLLRRAAQLRAEAAAPGDASWAAFEALLGVLEAAGALVRPGAEGAAGESLQRAAEEQQEARCAAEVQERQQQLDQGVAREGQNAPERVRFTPLGLVARDLNGQNELWLALVLTHPAFQGLPPPQLAAAVSAAVAPEAVSRSGGWVAYPPSAKVAAAVEALEGERARLAALQVAAGVEAPLPIDMRLAGIVEAWASGADWAAVMADCSLDDGDIVRLLSRTVDLLRQAAHCPHLLPPLRAAARRAVAAMDRKPISELVVGGG